jgi:hypothetical protein
MGVARPTTIVEGWSASALEEDLRDRNRGAALRLHAQHLAAMTWLQRAFFVVHQAQAP